MWERQDLHQALDGILFNPHYSSETHVTVGKELLLFFTCEETKAQRSESTWPDHLAEDLDPGLHD